MKIQFENKNLIVFESAIFRTSSILFHNEEIIFLVDPNYLPIEIAFIQKKVESIRKNQAVYLLYTHSDYDHIVGSECFDADKTIASQLFSTFKDKQMKAVSDFDISLYVKRPKRLNFPTISNVISEEGQSIKTNSNTFTFYFAPGHTADGLITLVEPENYLFVGDYLSNIEFPFIEDCPIKYLATLDKIEKIVNTNDIQLLVVGHGDHIHTKEEMLQRIANSREYINLIANITNDELFSHFPRGLSKKYPFFESVKEHHHKNVKLIREKITNKQV